MTADLFDVYDDHPEVVAVPLEQAVKEFQAHWEGHHAFFREFLDTPALRKERSDRWQQLTEVVELQLFRSIMAMGDLT